ncbi:MAG: phosphohistidine phosphatase SixA [Ignavibacteriota bacterium]
MLLYLLRHGIAEDHGSRSSDAERELTEEGVVKTRAILAAIEQMKFFSPELVISSPLIRARQTAKIALESFAKGAKFEISEVLRSESEVTDTMSLVAGHAKDFNRIMLVGHEPHLSRFGSALLGSPVSVIEMKKAAVAKFEINRIDVPRMRGHLIALFPPKIGSI